MNKKKTLTVWLTVIAVSLAVLLAYGLLNRTALREPTPEEIEAYTPYGILWQAIDGLEGTDTERILSLCTFVEEQTIGENRYRSYTSETLGRYLYRFEELTTVSLYLDPQTGEEGTLYIQYTDQNGRMVVLGYQGDQGLTEVGVYNADTDTFYHWMEEKWEVWEKFAKGARWGM